VSHLFYGRVRDLGEKDGEEGREQIIDSLHIAAGGVPHGPHVQHPLENVLHRLVLEDRHERVHARQVVEDLAQRLVVGVQVLAAVVRVHRLPVGEPLLLDAAALQLTLERHVVGHELPAARPERRRNAFPAGLLQLFCTAKGKWIRE